LARHAAALEGFMHSLQGRVTDHRVGFTEHGIEGVLSGARLDAFIDALQAHHRQQLLAGLGR
jgi:peptide chain release factor 1